MSTIQGADLIGYTVRDRITGFEGVVTGFVVYISGCNQALVVPKAKDGRMGDGAWIDEQRLETTDAHRVVLDNSRTPGCDAAPPIR